MLHVTCDTLWGVRISQNFSSPDLMVWERQCFTQLINQLITKVLVIVTVVTVAVATVALVTVVIVTSFSKTT